MKALETYATNLVKVWVATACKKRVGTLKKLYTQVLDSRVTTCPICDPPHPIDQSQIARTLQQIERILTSVSHVFYQARVENLDIERIG